MFRVTFLVDDPAERQRLATELRLLAVDSEARMVSAFTDAKTIEVYLDIAESADPRAVADRFAQRLGVSDLRTHSGGAARHRAAWKRAAERPWPFSTGGDHPGARPS